MGVDPIPGLLDRLIIAGGRDYTHPSGFFWLSRLEYFYGPVGIVLSGGCRGADKIGEAWARLRSVPILRFPADWNEHGPAAGPIRNKEMASQATAVALFPGGRGTASMKREAEKAGLPVFVYPKLEPED